MGDDILLNKIIKAIISPMDNCPLKIPSMQLENR